MNCQQAENLLFDYQEGSLGADIAGAVSRHLETCDECSALLNDLWQMKLVASRWQDEIPQSVNQQMPVSRAWNMPQVLAMTASVVALVLVLSDARFENQPDGFALRFGTPDYVSQDDLLAWQDSHDQLSAQLEQLTTRQVASDQLVLRTVLETSREERRDELRTLMTYWTESQSLQQRETAESLRYLMASQAEDERDIRQLSDALSRGLMQTNNM